MKPSPYEIFSEPWSTCFAGRGAADCACRSAQGLPASRWLGSTRATPSIGNRTSQSPAQKNQCMISDFAKNFAWRMPLILRNRTNRPAPIRIIRISDAEFGLQQRIDGLRIGLTAPGFHRLTDEPAEHCWLLLRLRDLVGIGCDDLIDRSFDRAGVGDLLHPAALDQGARIAALAPHDLEQVLGDLAGDRAVGDEIDDTPELSG